MKLGVQLVLLALFQLSADCGTIDSTDSYSYYELPKDCVPSSLFINSDTHHLYLPLSPPEQSIHQCHHDAKSGSFTQVQDIFLDGLNGTSIHSYFDLVPFTINNKPILGIEITYLNQTVHPQFYTSSKFLDTSLVPAAEICNTEMKSLGMRGYNSLAVVNRLTGMVYTRDKSENAIGFTDFSKSSCNTKLIPVKEYILNLFVDEGSNHLYLFLSSNILRVLDGSSGQLVHENRLHSAPSRFKIDANHRRIFCIYSDFKQSSMIQIYDTSTLTLINSIQLQPGSIHGFDIDQSNGFFHILYLDQLGYQRYVYSSDFNIIEHESVYNTGGGNIYNTIFSGLIVDQSNHYSYFYGGNSLEGFFIYSRRPRGTS
jgi:hypothetical protein